jgi:hypothetical protein
MLFDWLLRVHQLHLLLSQKYKQNGVKLLNSYKFYQKIKKNIIGRRNKAILFIVLLVKLISLAFVEFVFVLYMWKHLKKIKEYQKYRQKLQNWTNVFFWLKPLDIFSVKDKHSNTAVIIIPKIRTKQSDKNLRFYGFHGKSRCWKH